MLPTVNVWSSNHWTTRLDSILALSPGDSSQAVIWASPAAAAAKSHQSCPTLCDPIDGSPPGSHPWDSPGKNTGVGCYILLQCMKVKVKVKSLSRVRLFATPWTAAHQAPPSVGFSRQEYWSGVSLPSPTTGSGQG